MTLADYHDRLWGLWQTYGRFFGPKRLAAISGALAALAHPPFGFLPGLLGYGLLLFVLNADLGLKPLKRAFGIGFVAGFIYFLISCFWVAEAFLVDAQTYGWMAPFAVTILPAMVAFFWGLFGVVYAAFAPRSGLKSLLCFGVWFCAFEMIRGWIFTGFPWNPAGASWRAGSAMSQIASVIGVYGLSLITVTAFATIALIRPRDGLKGYAPVLAGLFVLLAGFGFGQFRLMTTEITPATTIVRIVQPNVGQEAKWTEGEFKRIFGDYVGMSVAPFRLAAWGDSTEKLTKTPLSPQGGAAKRHADVIIWPEGALPASAEELFSAESFTAEIFTKLLRPGQTLMMGVYRADSDTVKGTVWRNSLLVIQQKNDRTEIVAAYDKFKLVPFGEFLPFEEVLGKIGIKELVHVGDGFTAGARTKFMKVDNIPAFLPLICYEGLYPALDQSNHTNIPDGQRPQWIVNISNDAWFGPTTGPVQHLNLSSYRAIEQGLPMVRSTPTGISVVIDPLGRVIEASKLGIGEKGYIDVILPKPVKLTSYSKIYVGYVIFISIFCLILMPYDTFLWRIKNNPLRESLGFKSRKQE